MKRFLKFVALGVLLGLSLAFVQHILGIDEEIFQKYTYIALVSAFVLVVVYNLAYILPLSIAITKNMRLVGEGKANEAIRNLGELRDRAKKKKCRRLATICTVNLAAAYLDEHNFDMVIEELESIDSSRLNPELRLVYALNLMSAYLNTDKNKLACELYEENKGIIEKYKNDSRYRDTIALNTALILLSNNDIEGARKITEIARTKVKNEKYIKAFDIVETEIERIENGDDK